MNTNEVRVRFAPSPTGLMHIGNVRIALFNALFAKHNKGTFVLRIEDTDASREVDPGGIKIIKDLEWLGLSYNEGPFFQSKRASLYQAYFARLLEKGLVYRCFETHEELEEKRQRQIARGLPPRYDRAALKLSDEQVNQFLAEGRPYVWRFKLLEGTAVIKDLAHGDVTFDFSHFSDFTLTRPDGSFTFIFANFVDDVDMRISHVIRGGDHLSNTAMQAALYQALEAPMPQFFHMPLLCGPDGKKLSKRDFGFSLEDLRSGGFLPVAINNYLGIMGGSFEDEVMDFEALVKAVRFDHLSAASQVRYDVEKLRWLNHKWMARISADERAAFVLPLIKQAYPAAAHYTVDQVRALLEPISGELTTLVDAPALLRFVFERPTFLVAGAEPLNYMQHRAFFKSVLSMPADTGVELLEKIKEMAKAEKRSLKEVLSLLRLALTGSPTGLGIAELGILLDVNEIRVRIAPLAE
ncbi:MAG: Glutamate-tRNA ligase [candidate division TM6 bacterium GW2011_GWF2_43_87]|nr:MAG: Glutamate-tRNA ligase [candidate division TM6 bacterium GW2011_GWF2_43_87]